jgi:hypothetical protein
MSEEHDIVFANYWHDLKEYGIDSLTGEACAYGQRVLCDLSQEGVDLLTTYFGGQLVFVEGANWNPGSVENPSIASVLLPRCLLDDLRVFILFYKHNMTYAYVSETGSVIGTNEDHPLSPNSRRVTNFAKILKHPQRDGRNVHMATGRTK